MSILFRKPVADGLRLVEHHNPHYFWPGTSKVQAAVSVWRKRLSTLFTDSKIKHGHSHRFQDTFAVALLTSRVSLESVSQLLGHRSIKITMVYAGICGGAGGNRTLKPHC